MKSAVRFEHVLKDRLSDPDQAAKYPTACYEEGSDVFLQALRDVGEAQGGIPPKRWAWRRACQALS
jgi:DNA-binding phage protein